jgi:hypothetical protein
MLYDSTAPDEDMMGMDHFNHDDEEDQMFIY